ncbi:hypothetical protein AURDEDRAFT_126437 [Auricularia subglabra TFB-10046 SS5]|nr:hypothetical protein AURDEDRAFT_126437 [Auricularia subglabra TFB-10046 SS5]
MQHRLIAHRSPSLSLQEQYAAVTQHRVFTTRSQKPRENVEDPVEYLSESDDERLPSLAERAGLEGDLSDYEYPVHLRVFTRPMAEVLKDAEQWDRNRRQSASSASAIPVVHSKKTRRAGKWNKSRSSWTPAQREAEKASASYAARTAAVREARREERLNNRRNIAPPHAKQLVSDAQQYSSSFKLTDLASSGSVIGVPTTSRASINFALRQAMGPPPGCNEYVRNLVRREGFTYVPNARYSLTRKGSFMPSSLHSLWACSGRGRYNTYLTFCGGSMRNYT